MLAAIITLTADRKITRKHYIVPGGYEFVFRDRGHIRFDFKDSEREIDDDDGSKVNFFLRNLDFSVDESTKKLEEALLSDELVDIEEINVYTGEEGEDAEIHIESVNSFDFFIYKTNMNITIEFTPQILQKALEQ